MYTGGKLIAASILLRKAPGARETSRHFHEAIVSIRSCSLVINSGIKNKSLVNASSGRGGVILRA